jgi:hypothetical protein
MFPMLSNYLEEAYINVCIDCINNYSVEYLSKLLGVCDFKKVLGYPLGFSDSFYPFSAIFQGSNHRHKDYYIIMDPFDNLIIPGVKSKLNKKEIDLLYKLITLSIPMNNVSTANRDKSDNIKILKLKNNKYERLLSYKSFSQVNITRRQRLIKEIMIRKIILDGKL